MKAGCRPVGDVLGMERSWEVSGVKCQCFSTRSRGKKRARKKTWLFLSRRDSRQVGFQHWWVGLPGHRLQHAGLPLWNVEVSGYQEFLGSTGGWLSWQAGPFHTVSETGKTVLSLHFEDFGSPRSSVRLTSPPVHSGAVVDRSQPLSVARAW